MANPFLTLGGIAVGIVVATFGVLQVPGWVKSAQDASAINDLGSAAIAEGAASALGKGYMQGAELVAHAKELGANFTLSSGVTLCVSRNDDKSEYAAVAKSPSGAFFARTTGQSKAQKGATSADALAAVGGLPSGVSDPFVDGSCAPGTEIINHDGNAAGPDLGSDPDYQPFDAMFTYRCDVETEIVVPMMGPNGTATWSDQTEPFVTEGEPVHRTLAAGVTYQVTFDGTFMHLGSGEGNECLRSMDSWSDDSGTRTSYAAFRDAVNLVSVPANIPPTLTSLQEMFYGATSFNDADVAQWDVANIKQANNMFDGATAFQQDINGWHFSAEGWLVQVSEMFANTNYTGDLRNWTFDNPGDAQAIGMFLDASYTGDMSGWTFENDGSAFATLSDGSSTGTLDLTANNWRFANGGSAFTDDFISGKSGAKVTLNDWVYENTGSADMSGMFRSNGDVRVTADNWQIRSGGRVNMSTPLFRSPGISTVQMDNWRFAGKGMVDINLASTGSDDGRGATVRGSISGWTFENQDMVMATQFGANNPGVSFEADMTGWIFRNTGDVDVQAAFADSAYNGDVTGWDFDNTGNVFINRMFQNNRAFTGDISSWQLRNDAGLYADYMFDGATAFERDLRAWNVSNYVLNAGYDTFAPHLRSDYLPAFPTP